MTAVLHGFHGDSVEPNDQQSLRDPQVTFLMESKTDKIRFCIVKIVGKIMGNLKVTFLRRVVHQNEDFLNLKRRNGYDSFHKKRGAI